MEVIVQTGYRKPLKNLVLSDMSELLLIIIDSHYGKVQDWTQSACAGLGAFSVYFYGEAASSDIGTLLFVQRQLQSTSNSRFAWKYLVMHVEIASFVFNVCCFGMSYLLV